MKHLFATYVSMLLCTLAIAQADKPCADATLFSAMPNHSIRACNEKEFDELEIRQNVPGKSTVTAKKQGRKTVIDYKFDGEFSKIPAVLQILNNYSNAIKKAGGEVLYTSGGTIYGKLKKSDGTYWIEVTSDGSGDYWVSIVQEQEMKQDVVMNAAEIKNNLVADGKAIFYGIYFNTGQATLKPESGATLSEIAKFLKANPSINVYIVGHTDNTGNFESNMTLSKERANAVVNELIVKYAVNKSQLAAQGVASLAPVASNDNEAGRAKNRRVELVKK